MASERTRIALSDDLRAVLDFAGPKRTNRQRAEVLSGAVWRFLVDLDPADQATLVESWGWQKHTAMDVEMQVWSYKPPTERVPSDEGGSGHVCTDECAASEEAAEARFQGDGVCGHRGPRVGNDGVMTCVLPKGHEGNHMPHESWRQHGWSRLRQEGGGQRVMGKTFPTECPHGRILDWGDFGDPDNPETNVEHCDECQAEPDEFELVAYRYPAEGGGWGYSGVRLSSLDEPLYRRVPCNKEAPADG